QLVIAGYVITYAVFLVTGSRLGDILGHRRMFLAGLATFTLASLGCGLATSTAVLITLRFLQGAGAAAMIPQVLSLIQRTFDGPAPPDAPVRGRPGRRRGNRAGRWRRAGQREPVRRHLAPGLPAERPDRRDLVPRRAVVPARGPG